MAHFAKLNSNNVVIYVTVGRNDDDENELSARTGETYKRTSYNTVNNEHRLGGTPFRYFFAGVGFTYDPELDAFIPPGYTYHEEMDKFYPPKPAEFPSFVLNTNTMSWEPPTPKPEDSENEIHYWDEETLSWISAEIPSE